MNRVGVMVAEMRLCLILTWKIKDSFTEIKKTGLVVLSGRVGCRV